MGTRDAPSISSWLRSSHHLSSGCSTALATGWPRTPTSPMGHSSASPPRPAQFPRALGFRRLPSSPACTARRRTHVAPGSTAPSTGPVTHPARAPRCGTCGRCPRCRRWTEPEDAFVECLLGKVNAAAIALKLRDRFGIERTPTAVIQRLKRRGRSRWVETIRLRDIERIFRVGHRTIVRDWIGGGLLAARRRPGRGPPPRLELRSERDRGVHPGACVPARPIQYAAGPSVDQPGFA